MPNATDTQYTGSTPVYADDLRHVWDVLTEGVVNLVGGDLLVTAGATGLSVDVALGTAYVQGDDAADQGRYRTRLDAPVNSNSFAAGGIPAAHATNPRLDLIVLHVYDDEFDGSGMEGYELEVIPGTATSGATLVNRNGAAAVPDTALWLADVLVPATATSITAPNIADRRVRSIPAKARGAIFDHFASVGNVGTGEDDLYVDTIAANTLTRDGDKIIGTYSGTFVAHATATRQLKVYFAGTAIYDTGALTTTNAQFWKLEVVLIRASSSVVRYAVALISSDATGSQGSRIVKNGTLGSLDFTTTKVLKLTGQSAGTGGGVDNDIACLLGLVEWESAAA